MSMRLLTYSMGFLYFLFAGVTWVSGEAGQGAEGRITVADVFALLLVAIWVLSCVQDGRLGFKMPTGYRAYLPLLVVYTLGVALSLDPSRGALELVVHLFIFAVSLVLYNLYGRLPLKEAVSAALHSVLWAGGILALLGLIDFFVWPSLLPNLGDGLVGTFRNTGQAGAFFGMYLAILIPGFLSALIRPSRINYTLLLAIGFALVFTSKRAALAGLAVGLVGLGATLMLSKSKRDKKLGAGILLTAVLVAPLAYFAFLWGLENIEGMAWRFSKKFNASTVESLEEGFLAENISAATAAFSSSPVWGVGLSNVSGVFTLKYEIHSTYFSILASGGLLGMAAYIFFMALHTWQVFIGSRGSGRFALYLRYYFPMLIGLMFAWGYTYHLRKREFWILFFITTLVILCARVLPRSRDADSRGLRASYS